MSKLPTIPNVQVKTASGTHLFTISSKRIANHKMTGTFSENRKTFVLDLAWLDKLSCLDYDQTPACLCCGGDKGLTKHHVVPRRVVKLYPRLLSGKLFAKNLVTLCQRCHNAFNQKDKSGDRNLDPTYWITKLDRFMDSMRKDDAACADYRKRQGQPPQGGPVRTVPQAVLQGGGVGGRRDDPPRAGVPAPKVQDPQASSPGGQDVLRGDGGIEHDGEAPGRQVHVPAVERGAGQGDLPDVRPAGGVNRGLLCLVVALTCYCFKEETQMNLQEVIGKVPVQTVAVVVAAFLAYRWGRTVVAWAWENKYGVLREAVALTFLAVVLVALKAVQLPDEVPAVALPHVNVNLDDQHWNLTVGKSGLITLFAVLLVASIGAVWFGIADWHEHCNNKNNTLLKWQWSMVLTFAGIASAVLSLVFLCRCFVPAG